MSPKPIPTFYVNDLWQRLHRSESPVLARMLTLWEDEAVKRRLGNAAPSAITILPVAAGPLGGRFCPPNGPGTLYLGNDLDTCVAEMAYHHGRICAASTGTPAGTRATFTHLTFWAAGDMADATASRKKGLHSPSDYGPSWAFATDVRSVGLPGVYYRSVRRRGGRCLAIYEERSVVMRGLVYGAVVLEWDGSRSSRVA